MKAEELRIGNLVSNMNPRHNDSILTIESIGDNHEVNVFYRKYLLSELEPIPLTEEWLLKFGYCKKIGARVGYGYDCGHGIMRVIQYNATLYQYRTWSNIDRLNGFSWNKTRIDYVHQLQNLYFALTGEELTLKP